MNILSSNKNIENESKLIIFAKTILNKLLP